MILYLILLLGALGTISLPWMLGYYAEYFVDAYYSIPGYRRFILPFLIVVALAAMWVLLEMIGMLRTVPRDPFVQRNVKALRRVGLAGMGIAGLFFGKCLLYPTFLTMACGALLVLCGLFAFTLSSLFRRAVALREENDLTI
jgi:hypothetical protein